MLAFIDFDNQDLIRRWGYWEEDNNEQVRKSINSRTETSLIGNTK